MTAQRQLARWACLVAWTGLLMVGGSPVLRAGQQGIVLRAAPIPIVVFGDSFTAGLGLHRQDAFPAQLEARLRARGLAVKVIGSGVSGETTAGGLARLDRVLADRPQLMIIELGTNDALRGVQPRVVRANLGAMIAKTKATGTAMLLTGVRAPITWGESYMRTFDDVYPRLARELRVPIYPFFLEGVVRDRRLIQKDGLHPNREGVQVLAANIGPVVARLLQAEFAGQLLRSPDKIPVATGSGIMSMTAAEYAAAASGLGRLPSLSKAYVFGRTIPQPRTDRNGHIRVLDRAPDPSGQRQAPEQPDNPATPKPTQEKQAPMSAGGSRAARVDRRALVSQVYVRRGSRYQKRQ